MPSRKKNRKKAAANNVAEKIARRRDEIKSSEKQKKAVKQFRSTYTSLLNTLTATYPDSAVTSQHKVLVSSFTDDHWLELIGRWGRCLTAEASAMLKEKKEAVFQSCPELFDALGVKALWESAKLTENSKKYLWVYFGILQESSRAVFPVKDAPEDIAPPIVNGDASKLFQTLCGKLPMGMMKKVQRVAESYGKKLRDKGGSIDDIKFDEVSQELFKSIDPSEMKQVVASVSDLVKNISAR